MNMKLNDCRAWLAFSLLFALAGCSLAPTYKQPALPIPAQWEESVELGEGARQPHWRDFFADPELIKLVELALEHNRDLHLAALNVSEARALYGITRADQLPNLGLEGSATRSRTAGDFSATGDDFTASRYQVGLGLAAFELDFLQRVRNLSQAALNEYLASAQARDSAQIALVSAVAKAYFSALAAYESMQISANMLRTQEESYALSELRYKVGVISALDLRRIETQIAGAKAEYAAQKLRYDQAYNALSLLVGMKTIRRSTTGMALDQQFKLDNLPVGLSSEVMQTRPDVRAAEHQLRAANARIGAARAAFFPRITLMGNYGNMSSDLDRLFDGPNNVWSFVPSISVPIFQGGRLRSSLDLAQVRQEKSIVQYEKIVQQAFTDVANALSAKENLKNQRIAQNEIYIAAAEAYRLVDISYRAGTTDSLQRLDAVRESFSAHLGLIAVRLLEANNMIDLYAALGGGLSSPEGEMQTKDGSEVEAKE